VIYISPELPGRSHILPGRSRLYNI